MSNIDKQALRELIREAGNRKIIVHAKTVSDLLDELEAYEKTSEARKQGLIRAHKMFQRERYRAEAAEKRIAELEARQPYGYLRENDGQIQISIGSNRPHDRSGGYATPWFAIYTAAGVGVKGE
ncbi:hypothetical protein [Citrobacter braakii]|uniref:hypothetical protein n=1 Tax=Citrobacter braakii TaxID=57706 RepID=UPI0032BF3294